MSRADTLALYAYGAVLGLAGALLLIIGVTR